MKIRIVIIMLVMGLLLAVGCTAGRPTSEPAAEPVAPEGPTVPEEPIGTPADAGGEDAPADAPALSGGEVPQELFGAVLDDLLARSGKTRSDVTVVSAEAITWSDGALGCPQPGMMYTQALVDGYQVVFDVGGERFDYHLSDGGDFVLCEGLR